MEPTVHSAAPPQPKYKPVPGFPPRRFKPVSHFAEFEGAYNVGGFHPVQFNEIFNNRYVVFRKLGFATQSTVWLAEDQTTGGYVTLKVTMAKFSSDKTLEVTFTRDPALQEQPGAKHLCTKSDAFQFEGPNGTHLVLVFEPLGRSFEEVLENSSRCIRDAGFHPGEYGTKEWSARFGREACRQLVLGLDYLHSQKVMHRDIQPGNILLALTYDLDALTKDEIQHDVWNDDDVEGDQNTMSKEAWAKMNIHRQVDYINVIERNDGEPLASNDPNYTVASISLHDRLKLDPVPEPTDFCIKLIDLGGACKFEDCNDGTTPYPIDIRAPEVILRRPYNEKADIWALACTIFRIVTLEPLMPIWMTSDKDDTDEQHMRYVIERFGKLPEHLRSDWARADKNLDQHGNLIDPPDEESDNEDADSKDSEIKNTHSRDADSDNSDDEESGDESESAESEPEKESYQTGDLWHAVRLAKPNDMSDEEAKSFYDLLKRMLDYDSANRPFTKEVLEHPWFKTS